MFVLVLMKDRGLSSEPTTLQEGDDILWRENMIVFQRRIPLPQISGYVRIRSTDTVQMRVMQSADGGLLHDSLPLRLSNRRVDALPVILMEYGLVLPGLRCFKWQRLGLGECLPGRQRFRAVVPYPS